MPQKKRTKSVCWSMSRRVLQTAWPCLGRETLTKVAPASQPIAQGEPKHTEVGALTHLLSLVAVVATKTQANKRGREL